MSIHSATYAQILGLDICGMSNSAKLPRAKRKQAFMQCQPSIPFPPLGHTLEGASAWETWPVSLQQKLTGLGTLPYNLPCNMFCNLASLVPLTALLCVALVNKYCCAYIGQRTKSLSFSCWNGWTTWDRNGKNLLKQTSQWISLSLGLMVSRDLLHVIKTDGSLGIYSWEVAYVAFSWSCHWSGVRPLGKDFPVVAFLVFYWFCLFGYF